LRDKADTIKVGAPDLHTGRECANESIAMTAHLSQDKASPPARIALLGSLSLQSHSRSLRENLTVKLETSELLVLARTMLIRSLVACALVHCSLARGQGGPPMVTDDPGTPGNGHWEINVAWLGERSSGETMQDEPLLDMNYGVGERIQLKYEVPWLAVRDPDLGSRSGVGDSLAGVKWRFYDTGDPKGWQISTYPQFEFNTFSRSYQRGIVEQGSGWLLPLEFQKNFGPVSVNYEVGRTLRTQGAFQDQWFGGVVLGKELTSRLEVMAEIQGTFARSFNTSGTILNGGMRYKLRGPFTLLAAAGTGVAGADRPSWIGYFGLQFSSE
jgi:hypothetical protein